MSYFLTRLRVSLVARQVVDQCAANGCSSYADLDYDEVLQLDAELRAIWNDIPVFYRLDEESQKASKALHRERPYLLFDTFIMGIGFYARLSALHRPYLAKAVKDQRYDYSRSVSLDAARTAIYYAKQMHSSNLDVSPALLQVSTATKNLFISILVLAMEYYFNNNSTSLRDEIMEACKILEQSTGHNSIAQRGLDQVKTALNEWKQSNTKYSASSNAQLQALEFPSTNDSLATANNIDLASLDGEGFDNSFPQWLDFDATLDLDWDTLFTQIDGNELFPVVEHSQ